MQRSVKNATGDAVRADEAEQQGAASDLASNRGMTGEVICAAEPKKLHVG